MRCVLEKADVATEDGVYDPAQASMVLAGIRIGLSVDEVKVIATSCASNRSKYFLVLKHESYVIPT